MSGTSLDGVDIAYVKFTEDKYKWYFELLKCTTVSYNSNMKELLISAEAKRAKVGWTICI